MKVSVSQLAKMMNGRFEHMLLSVDAAIVMSGQKTKEMRMLEDSEQFEARRELLLVEEVANKIREQEQDETDSRVRQVEADFHLSLIADMKEKFQKPDYLFSELMGFNPAMGKMLDILYTEACSISRLESCIAEMEWLKNALIKFVKQPQYRRVDSNGSPMIIETLRGALTFVGIESLRILLPALIAKRSLPAKSEDFPELTKNLWEYSLGSGKACHAIAEKDGVKWHLAYTAGLFSTFGRSAIARMYLKSFDQKLQEKIEEARAQNNPNQAQLLATLQPSPTYLISLWQRYANQITFDIIQHMQCKWLVIAAAFEDYVRIKEVSIKAVDSLNVHPLTRLLFQCQGYMQFKMMKSHGLLSKQSSMLYLRNFGVKAEDVVLLTKVNLTGLEINIAEQ